MADKVKMDVRKYPIGNQFTVVQCENMEYSTNLTEKSINAGKEENKMSSIIFELRNGRQLVISKKDSHTAEVAVYDSDEELEDEVTLNAERLRQSIFGEI